MARYVFEFLRSFCIGYNEIWLLMSLSLISFCIGYNDEIWLGMSLNLFLYRISCYMARCLFEFLPLLSFCIEYHDEICLVMFLNLFLFSLSGKDVRWDLVAELPYVNLFANASNISIFWGYFVPSPFCALLVRLQCCNQFSGSPLGGAVGCWSVVVVQT